MEQPRSILGDRHRRSTGTVHQLPSKSTVINLLALKKLFKDNSIPADHRSASTSQYTILKCVFNMVKPKNWWGTQKLL